MHFWLCFLYNLCQCKGYGICYQITFGGRWLGNTAITIQSAGHSGRECLCVNNKMASAPKEPRAGKLFLFWANTALPRPMAGPGSPLGWGPVCRHREYTLPGRKPGKVCILVCLNQGEQEGQKSRICCFSQHFGGISLEQSFLRRGLNKN